MGNVQSGPSFCMKPCALPNTSESQYQHEVQERSKKFDAVEEAELGADDLSEKNSLRSVHCACLLHPGLAAVQMENFGLIGR